MNASHLTLKRTTAIITVMLLLVVETPPTLSENIVHHQIQQQQHKQQQEENFLDKNPRHQLRPSTQITIDLNYFHIMENMTLLSSTAARRTNDVNDKKKETFFVPRNPAANMLNFPARRYSLWSELTSTEKTYAQILKYTESTWDNPYANPIEAQPYKNLNAQKKSALEMLGISSTQWDCHINHYYGFYWDDLMSTAIGDGGAGLHVYFAMLGWDRESWDYENVTRPDVEHLMWDELNERQKLIASEICYFRKEVWDELPLSTWLEEWRRSSKVKDKAAY